MNTTAPTPRPNLHAADASGSSTTRRVRGAVLVVGGMQLWRQGRYHPWFSRIAGAMAVVTVVGIYRLNNVFA
ncbi:MAG: hypothetical protein ACOVQT_16075 [Rubrivivax sp.]|jgi:hypothetical protein|nr:hypothetical protein [Rubrivivax sp.]